MERVQRGHELVYCRYGVYDVLACAVLPSLESFGLSIALQIVPKVYKGIHLG